MDALPRTRMSAEAFIAWSMEQPAGCRYELADGEVFEMASGRLQHARAKGAIYRRMADAVERAGLPCEVYPDGVAIQIDENTVYEPDAAVRCGALLGGDTIVYTDPVIVAEVLSPSTRHLDTGGKLAGYFSLPSLRHYLIVDPAKQQVIHHQRNGAEIQTRLLRDGILMMEPPGLRLEVARLFG